MPGIADPPHRPLVLAHVGDSVERARRSMAVDQIGLAHWTAVRHVYRDLHARHAAGHLGPWDEFEPAYRYAREMRALPQYRHRACGHVEADLRRGWSMS